MLRSCLLGTSFGPSRIFRILLLSLLFIMPAQAHHSFAVYDFDVQTRFEGTVKTLKFINPHISMTLAVVDENGEEKTIDFVDGPPANMMVRNGIRPNMIQPGSKVVTFGSPLREDPNQFFLRRIITEDGTEYAN